jgi:hypothetical protein
MKGMTRAGTLSMYARYSAATVGSFVIRSSYKINRLYAICIYKYAMLTSMGILKANAAAMMPSPTSGAWDQNITEKSACWISTKLRRHQNYLNLTRDLAEANDLRVHWMTHHRVWTSLHEFGTLPSLVRVADQLIDSST